MTVTDKDEGIQLLSEFSDATSDNVTDLEDIQSNNEVKSRTPTQVKGIATKAVLLLAVCGIAAIAYAHFNPQAGVESSEPAKVPSMEAAISLVADKPPTAHVVARILKQVAGRARQLPQQPRSLGAKGHTKMENATKEIEASAPERQMEMVHKHRDVIIAAVNEMADRNVEEVAAKGEAITSAMLQEINGLTGTPELAQLNLSGHAMSTGDMIFQSREVFEGRRLWAGALWPDKKNIGYCYHSQAPQETRNAFMRAINHITNLVGCIGFKEVPNLGDVWCKDNGIFITAFAGPTKPNGYTGKPPVPSGCFAYVGKIPRVQQLNLEPGGCDSLGIAAHEVLHALGMQHEQARSDYAQHVTIYWENINSAMSNNYDMDPKGDTTLPYDILSLMHYGDTDFSSNGQKTMTPVAVIGPDGKPKIPRGTMGQRMGLSGFDATQLSNMYSCPVRKFMLCTNSQTECTKESCVCHSYEGSPIVKVPARDAAGNPRSDCFRCSKRCPDYTQGTCDLGCDCGMGYVRLKLPMGNGHFCYACQLGAPLKTQKAGPLTNPPPADNPNDPCVFPTSPDSCPQKAMPGCTNCDASNSPPWCFMKPGNDGKGRYRDCKKTDDACLFPFTYNDVDRYTCITEGDKNGGLPWCMKFGGGWKFCGKQEGYEGSVPIEAYGAGPTPAPKALSVKSDAPVVMMPGLGGGGSSR